MSQPQSTASRVFNLATELERDVALASALPRKHEGRAPLPPMPDYVEHRPGVTEVGRLSAEAMVREFESAAKEVDAMGAELQDAAKRCEAMVSEAHAAIAEC